MSSTLFGSTAGGVASRPVRSSKKKVAGQTATETLFQGGRGREKSLDPDTSRLGNKLRATRTLAHVIACTSALTRQIWLIRAMGHPNRSCERTTTRP